MNFIRNNIPNAITAGNLFCGLLAIHASFEGNFGIAGMYVIAAGVLDFFDGLIARLLKADTKIGKDLDSLADVVSFGAAPVFIYTNMHSMYDLRLGKEETKLLVQYIPFLVVIFSAIRLAIFNNDPRQTDSFIGLPTPANGFLIASFALIEAYNPAYFPKFVLHPLFMVGFSVLSCYMLVMPYPLFALKFKHWAFKGNEVRYLFLATAALLIVLFKFASIPLIIFLYILLSLVLTFVKR